MKYSLVITSLILLCMGCTASMQVSRTPDETLLGDQLKPLGRYALDGKALEMVSSGVHFAVTFEGVECRIVTRLSAGQNHNYLQYELDGKYQGRIRVKGPQFDTINIPVTGGGNHTLVIYKATEAHTGPVFIHSLKAKRIRAAQVKDAPLIEFIGNSITCGAAADTSDVPCGKGQYHDQHNAYLAYGPRVSRDLNTNFILSSVSGIGIYRNWNSDGPVMPDVYQNIDFQEASTRKWNFAAYNPVIVSIALGTNDFSNGDGTRRRLPFDSAIFTARYVDFVKQVKARYPAAKVALLNSPMVSGINHDVFVECLRRVKLKIDATYPMDQPVSVFISQPMSPSGCSYHPDVSDHQTLANQLIPFFRSLLGK